MKTIEREYPTLKIFRGMRKDSELCKLSEEERDFEYRRLLIEENELDLHVFYSRKYISEVISWMTIVLAFLLIQHHIFSLTFFIISLFLQLVKTYWLRRLNATFRRYMFSLNIVNIVIKKEYGMSLP